MGLRTVDRLPLLESLSYAKQSKNFNSCVKSLCSFSKTLLKHGWNLLLFEYFWSPYGPLRPLLPSKDNSVLACLVSPLCSPSEGNFVSCQLDSWVAVTKSQQDNKNEVGLEGPNSTGEERVGSPGEQWRENAVKESSRWPLAMRKEEGKKNLGQDG